MGRLFTSYDEAWEFFLGRHEPLESFYAALPADDDAVLDGWFIEPSADVKQRAAALQRAFAHLDWLAPVPGHLLHVTLPGPISGPPVEIEYRRVNCFHEAIFVEVHAPELSRAGGAPFLPHLTLALARRPHDPGPLRDVLIPLRDAWVGRQVVTEILRCRIPIGRCTVLQPWTVDARVTLSGR